MPGIESREPGKPVYHYSREDRISRLPPSRRPRSSRSSFFIRHRATLILLVDILLIAAAGFILVPLLRPPNSRVAGPFRFDLDVRQFSGNLYAVLSVTSLRNSSDPPESAEISVSCGGAWRKTYQNLPPAVKGEIRTIAFSLPLPSSPAKVRLRLKTPLWTVELESRQDFILPPDG